MDLLIKIISLSLAQQYISDSQGNLLTQQEVENLLFKFNSYLLSLLNYKVNNIEVAEDILQETYLSFLAGINKKGNTFNNEKKLKNYLTTIALNKTKDYYKSQGYKQQKLYSFSTTEELDLFLKNCSSTEKTPEEELVEKEKKEQVNNSVNLVMEQLPEKYKQVLVLKFTENKTNIEISSIIDMSVKAVESQLFRAKKKFKKELEKYMVNVNEK